MPHEGRGRSLGAYSPTSGRAPPCLAPASSRAALQLLALRRLTSPDAELSINLEGMFEALLSDRTPGAHSPGA